MSRHHKQKTGMERRFLIVSRLQFCLRSNSVIGDMRISIFYDDGHPPSPACCGCKYGLRYVNRTADQNLNKPLWEPLCRLVREMFKTPITSPHPPKIQIFNHSILIMSESLLHLCCFGVFSLYGFFRGKTIQLFRTSMFDIDFISA